MLNCPYCAIEVSEHPASKCLDTWVAETVMGYKKGVSLPNSAGSMPPDAEVIDTGNPWTTTSKGGTYPYLVGDILFVKRGFGGRHWSPSTSIADAWKVMEKFGGRFDLEKDMQYNKEGDEQGIIWSVIFLGEVALRMNEGYGDTAQLAICRAALEALDV